MKRDYFLQRSTTFPVQFVRDCNESRELNSVPSVLERPFVRRRIFVIKKTSRLPATTGPVKTIRRILIFDDHPDSLRLILGRPANRRAYRPTGDRASSRNLILPGMAILIALIAMFWPLF